jgi:hypothetical protein
VAWLLLVGGMIGCLASFVLTIENLDAPGTDP